MYLEAGKQIEKLLVGGVIHPIPDKLDLIRSEVQKFRDKFGWNFDKKMNFVRMDQVEKNPSNPKALFAKNLLYDLDEAMGDITDIEDGERYDLRIYSSVDTVLDHDHKFDCWIELVDIQQNKVIADYRVDITINPEKYYPSGDADAVYYFNEKYNDDEKRGKLDFAYREDGEYKKLIEGASALLSERGQIAYPLAA